MVKKQEVREKLLTKRRRAREVETACLENKYTGNRIGGSNPPASALSASSKTALQKGGFYYTIFWQCQMKKIKL